MSATQQPRSPLPESALDFIPGRNGKRTNLFDRFPREVISLIFANMATREDFKAAAATCKKAQMITQTNEQFIAHARIDYMLPPSVQKLGIMAVASRKFNHHNVEGFIEQYMSRKDDDQRVHASMEMAFALPDLLRAAEIVMQTKLNRTPYPDRYPSGDSTPAEYARELRACFMIETARNLFDGSQEDSDEETFGERKRVFWKAFSKVEVQAARAMFDSYEQCVFEALKCEQGGWSGCCVRERDIERQHFSNAETRSLARVFAIEAGLVQIGKWYTKELSPHASFHSFKSDRSGQNEGYQHFDEFLEDANTVFAQLPFQRDPKAINLTTRKEFLETDQYGIRSNYFICSDLEKHLECQIFWDQDTFTAWQQQAREMRLHTWSDPTEDESESEPEPEPEPESEPESESESEGEYEPNDRLVYDSDNYEFDSVSDWELGGELWARWSSSSSTMGFMEWMRHEKMCRQEEFEDEDEYY
ncbi:hypothetical protein F4813DRAFT_391367 [Daldinia decipiens]|uniref:uncharacterized protein n=1 Tax=Daldinia decipiens TaxID=326647 RepID=UPI0020C58AFC|nr:uncharacterized protein F4813DRAFT_391367 [Daldinia decipiens]KAI1655792.1 hypothetical protein F4813DRAFT_391367 [Daldinia decipiens]